MYLTPTMSVLFVRAVVCSVGGGEASRRHWPPRRYRLITESDHITGQWGPQPSWIADKEATLGPASTVASESPMSCLESSGGLPAEQTAGKYGLAGLG